MRSLRDVAATLIVLACRSALSLVASFALLAIAPALLGMTSTVVMSDSMAPGIMAGDVVAVRPVRTASIRVGQVVLVDDPSFPGRLRLHRVAAEEDGRFVLKGDANAQRDPTAVDSAAVHGVGFLRIPWIGLPLLWLRSGHVVLALLALAGIAGAAAVVAVLDRAGGSGGLRIALRAVRVLGRRHGRLAWFGVLGVLVAAPTMHGDRLADTGAWAAFTGSSTSPSDVFGANSTFASSSCWALPSPAPSIAYSFSAASGTSETNVGSLGSSTAYNAVLSSAALRTGGTCASGNGPSLQFTGSGSESVTSTGTFSAASSGTQSIWFLATSTRGVLFDLGAKNGATAASTDRQLYFTTDGSLAFVMQNGGSPVSCRITTAVTTGAWHFAAVSYDNSAKKFVLYYDGSTTSCSGTLTTAPTSTSYGRIGSDVSIASDASSGAFAGRVDEDYAWGTVLTATQIASVMSGGH